MWSFKKEMYKTSNENTSSSIFFQNDINWVIGGTNPCSANPWVISQDKLSISYIIENSENCGGTCASLQAGTATATITVGSFDVNLNLSFEGEGELQAPNYELIKFYLNNLLLADGHAAGGNLGCQTGPIISTIHQPGPYLLLANTTYTFLIDFTTNDQLYHNGAYYTCNLILELV